MKEPAAVSGMTGRESDPISPPAGLDPLSREGEKISRREMLKILGAGLTLAAGFTGCVRKPDRRIISRAGGPEYQHPGIPLTYASTWTAGPYPYGMTVKTLEGRPVKIEGQPEAERTGGGTTAAMQAVLYSLYDPGRMKALRGAPSWGEADTLVVAALRGEKRTALLTGSNLGPDEETLVAGLQERSPGLRHFTYEPWHDRLPRNVWKESYGAAGEIRPRFDRARVILAVEADFLGVDGPVLEYAAAFARGRKADDASPRLTRMSRLYVAESGFSLTGANADHRILLAPSRAAAWLRALRLAVSGLSGEWEALVRQEGIPGRVAAALVEDLGRARGEAVVWLGRHLPLAALAEAVLLNEDLGAPGKTLAWHPVPATRTADDPREIRQFLAAGVELLILLEVNPQYDFPGNFTPLLKQARLSVGQDLYETETVLACTLGLPSSHPLESWNESRICPGVTGLCQPVIAPLYATRQRAESLFAWHRALGGNGGETEGPADWHAYLRTSWQRRNVTDPLAKLQAESRWEEALRQGGGGGEIAVPFPPLRRETALALAARTGGGATRPAIGPGVRECEVVLKPHHAVYDGRFADNDWLQEWPDPLTKLVWGNAAVMAPGTARKLSLAEEGIVRLSGPRGGVELPVLELPGISEGVIYVTLGHGRGRPGRGEAGGVNAALLLGEGTDEESGCLVRVTAEAVPGRVHLARLQGHFSQEGRPLALDATLAEFARDPGFVKRRRDLPVPVDLYQAREYAFSRDFKWAMGVDLSLCLGCGGCVVACQAENNIPVVGKEDCLKGRAMHWLRIDRYTAPGDGESVTHFLPMLCQQCDQAPCENVCPVHATNHGPDGLNQMVYNRCIGTRYCSNNCPYKVRRFNFHDFAGRALRHPGQEQAHNPAVTVRSVGVMEKCTFCVQRLVEARFRASGAGRPLADGEARPACVQSCPTGALVFGNLRDPRSRISLLLQSPRRYRVLEELGTGPNVHYLARIRNPALPGPGTPS